MNITYKGDKDGMEKYLNHLMTGKRLHVTHYEDELSAEELKAAMETRESDEYDLNTCHEQ